MPDQEPPRPPIARPNTRTADLRTPILALLLGAMEALAEGRIEVAVQAVATPLQESPDHPDVLRVAGVVDNALGHHRQALARLERADARRPDDPPILIDLGNAQHGCGDVEAAYASWRRACALAPAEPTGWFNLGRNLQVEGRTSEALDALTEAIRRAPDALPPRILRADALVHLGRFDEADSEYREALWRDSASGDAWRGLASIKTRPLPEEDREQLEMNHDRADIAAADRIAMGYALGKVYEDEHRYADAFRVLEAANAEQRAQAPWDAAAFHAEVVDIVAHTDRLPTPLDPKLGSEVIFIVGLPRSGSTLVEQILSAHPDVEGASELPDLARVLGDESERRALPFPRWLPDADADDWHRLGRDYLHRTARWRARKPRFTDKMPENWLYAGVLQVMLPAACIVETRRDPLETGWSCFKQPFYRLPHFSCDLADIGAYLHDCDEAMARWQARSPGRIRSQSYEAVLAEPDAQIRALLAWCGLDFDPRCLAFHRSERSVRTASASQVREPIRRDTARARHYGTLLAPLSDVLRPA